jgi:hypothetical protein
MRFIIGLLVLLTAGPGYARRPDIEITPFLGYRWGGGIEVQERAFRGRDYDVTVDPSGSYGLRVGLDLTTRLQVEILASRQDSKLQDEYGLFGEEPGGFFPQGDTDVIDYSVSSVHVGVLWHFTSGANRLYGTVSTGIVYTDPALPLPSERSFSLGAGGGIKMDLTEHQGLRFELRCTWADTDGAARAVAQFEHPDCPAGADCEYIYLGRDSLIQTEVMLGYSLRI